MQSSLSVFPRHPIACCRSPGQQGIVIHLDPGIGDSLAKRFCKPRSPGVDTAPIEGGDEYIAQQFCVGERRKDHRIISGRNVFAVSGFAGKEGRPFPHMAGINPADRTGMVEFITGRLAVNRFKGEGRPGVVAFVPDTMAVCQRYG